MKTNTIKLAPAEFTDIDVIGINSSLADYKLAWFINNKLSFKLARKEDIEEDGAEYAFYLYDKRVHGEGEAYDFVSLLHKGTYWRTTKPRIDFLLVIRNSNDAEKMDSILKGIREIPGVGHAFFMDPQSDTSLAYILEVIEVHENDVVEAKGMLANLAAVREKVMKREELRQKLITQS